MQTCLCMGSDGGSGDDELRISNSARPQERRVTRREGDSATHGARFRLVSDNDDVKRTRVSGSQVQPSLLQREYYVPEYVFSNNQTFKVHGTNYFTEIR